MILNEKYFLNSFVVCVYRLHSVLKREKNIYNILERILFEREISLFLSLIYEHTHTLQGALDMRKRRRGIYYYYYSGAQQVRRQEGRTVYHHHRHSMCVWMVTSYLRNIQKGEFHVIRSWQCNFTESVEKRKNSISLICRRRKMALEKVMRGILFLFEESSNVGGLSETVK